MSRTTAGMFASISTSFSRSKNRWRRAGGLGGDAGLTLVELLIATALGLVVLGAVSGLMISSQKTESRNAEWASAIAEGRTGLARMTHDIRQAYDIQSTTFNSIDFYASIGGKSWEIEYDCDVEQPGTTFNECVRRAAEFEDGKPPSSLPSAGEPVIRNVLNGSPAGPPKIFTEFAPTAIAPDLVTIQLVVPAAGNLKLADAAPYHHDVVLSDAAYIRNMALGT